MALLQTGDIVRIDLKECTANIMISDEELNKRRQELEESGGYQIPESHTPWQQYFRELTGGLDTGMTLRDATNYRDTARKGMPRDSH